MNQESMPNPDWAMRAAEEFFCWYTNAPPCEHTKDDYDAVDPCDACCKAKVADIIRKHAGEEEGIALAKAVIDLRHNELCCSRYKSAYEDAPCDPNVCNVGQARAYLREREGE